MGLLDNKWDISPRDADAPPWENAPNQDWEDLRMAVYAAQIDRMDQGVGRVMSRVRELGQEENTLVMFLSDNGGCAELLREDGGSSRPSLYGMPTVDGRPMRLGNNTSLRPGPADTFMSYDLPWANASNVPFRLFKHWVHEGGISTPFIVNWPAKIPESGIVHSPAHLIDVAATCIEAAGAPYPSELNGSPITPLEGESLMPAIEGRRRERPIVWEHEGNRAVRVGPWKLVGEHPGKWELYNMDEDRTELNDLAGGDPARVGEMATTYKDWAERCGVLPWPVDPDQRPSNVRGEHTNISRLGSR